MINADQCRAARGLVDWSIRRLAEESGVSVAHLSAFERDGTVDRRVVRAIARALEVAGTAFVPERRA